MFDHFSLCHVRLYNIYPHPNNSTYVYEALACVQVSIYWPFSIVSFQLQPSRCFLSSLYIVLHGSAFAHFSNSFGFAGLIQGMTCDPLSTHIWWQAPGSSPILAAVFYQILILPLICIYPIPISQGTVNSNSISRHVWEEKMTSGYNRVCNGNFGNFSVDLHYEIMCCRKVNHQNHAWGSSLDTLFP